MVNDRIRISVSVARWMVSLGRQLVNEAYGIQWDPMADGALPDIDVMQRGFMDDIPMDNHPLYFWADALVRFTRVMAAIAARELLQEDQLIETDDDIISILNE